MACPNPLNGAPSEISVRRARDRHGRRRLRHRHEVRYVSHGAPPGPARRVACGMDERRRGFLEPATRSEEHTSELQSLTNLVCRLLLEKKKKNRIGGCR